MDLREHPDIEWCHRTGYPRYNQPAPIICERCEDEIDEDDIYDDESHEYLCRECLLELHRKSWW